MRPEERLPLNPRDFLILLILTRGDRHGYGIIKASEEYAGRAIRFDPANLYRALRRLDRDGLVTVSGDARRSEGASPRRIYALTDTGRAVVQAESARLARLTDTARAWHLIPDAGQGR